MKIEHYEDQAREMLRAQLAKHQDDGVRALNEIMEPPIESVRRVAAALHAAAIRSGEQDQ